MTTDLQLSYAHWRHGGWYTNVMYPSGACGCVSRNYVDKKWRIVCDERPFEKRPTFKNRDEAARAEYDLIEYAKRVAEHLYPDAVYRGADPYNTPEGKAWGKKVKSVIEALGRAA